MDSKINLVELWEGDSTRDFMYVDDIIDGLIRLANINGSIGPVNFGLGEQITIRELVQLIISLTSDKELVFTKPNAVRSFLYANNSLAKDTLGWNPEIGIRRGLEEIIKHYKELK